MVPKQDNLFDLLGSENPESEKTESKDLFGGFVNATTSSTNDILFNPFVSKPNSQVNF